MKHDKNDFTWSSVLNDMFQVPKRDCTPLAILETMKALTIRNGKPLTLDDITHHAKIRNITCTDAEVLAALRILWKQGKIRHRNWRDAGSVDRFWITPQ